MPKKNKKKQQRSLSIDYKQIDKCLRKCIKSKEDDRTNIDSLLKKVDRQFFDRFTTADPILCYAVQRNHICTYSDLHIELRHSFYLIIECTTASSVIFK